MDTIASELIRLLEEEASFHRKLLDNINRERDIVKRFAVNELTANTQEKENLILAIRVREKTRKNILSKIRTDVSPGENLTLSQVAQMCPEPYRTRLLELRAELLSITGEVSRLNDRNRVLVMSAHNAMNNLLTMIHGAGRQQNNTYDFKGRAGSKPGNPYMISHNV